jgi:hypothetical protein
MGPYNLTKSQTDTIFLTSSKVDVTERPQIIFRNQRHFFPEKFSLFAKTILICEVSHRKVKQFFFAYQNVFLCYRLSLELFLCCFGCRD